MEEENLTDNRMGFIRLLDSKEPRDYCTDYEFASEAYVTGELRYSGNDLILRLITSEPDRNGLFKYILSLSAPAAYKLPRPHSSKDGYSFGKGITEEILTLSSLYLRCRLFPISSTFRDTNGPPMTKHEYDFSYTRPHKNIDKYLFDSSKRNFVSLASFFDEVRKLPENLHHRFANAARLYALAVKEIGVDDQLAYIHLVSAIEVLSLYHPLSDDQDPLQKVMDEIKNLLDNKDPHIKSELGNLFNQRKTQRKFIRFIEEYQCDSVSERPPEGGFKYKIYKDNLPDALNRIYKARSKFLHEGASMYLSMPMPPITGKEGDYDFSQGQIMDNREYDPEDKLPNISFFENLVRICLLEYLKKHKSINIENLAQFCHTENGR